MLPNDLLKRAFFQMCTARSMANIYEANRSICKYVHSTSRGHEAIQLAIGFQLEPFDYVSPYYRDESMLLGLGFSPYELMLQLLAKGEDIFTAGREYYSHPNSKDPSKPTIIHQSSATGMQAIPTTGIAQGIKYKQVVAKLNGNPINSSSSIVVCSMGDAAVTEGEVSEAFQFAALHQLPIIFLIQDNEWGISVTSEESRLGNAYEFIAGFKGFERLSVDGSDFEKSYTAAALAIENVRSGNGPVLLHASVPLLGHHTSGVRKEFYRDENELKAAEKRDPLEKLKKLLLERGIPTEDIHEMEKRAVEEVAAAFDKAVASPEPSTSSVTDFVFVPTPIIEEKGIRSPDGNSVIPMVDAGLYAIREIMEQFPEALLYGQDVGKRLGGVFREAATLGDQFGNHRVFNTAIQEAYIIGSTVGMCAMGLKPIVEIQFADYIYSGFNQLVTEVSKSCYLSAGKFPVQTLIRVPIGAYGGGGPYHSGCNESTFLSIKGIKVVFPSNAADMKGLMKAAFLDPNPVVMLEHKGLYWSKVPGTEDAKCIEPSSDYIIPLGKGRVVLQAKSSLIASGKSCCIITYGMGVYWSKIAANNFIGQVEIIDLRTLYPLDEDMVFAAVKRHGKCLIVTEEQLNNSFAEALSGRIAKNCFQFLDAAVDVIGALNLPAVPMNIELEAAMLPSANKVAERLKLLLQY